MLFKESISAAVLPIRVILNRGDDNGRVDSGVGENGAFCMPILGDIRSFWLSVGTDSDSAIAMDKSWSVASGLNDSICFSP